MNLMRKAAIASSSTILLTVAGAMTGIGSSAAQAYDLTSSNEQVTIALNPSETLGAAAYKGVASVLCETAVPQAVQLPNLFAPIMDFNCAPALHDCAAQAVAAGRQVATVVFRWDSITCHF